MKYYISWYHSYPDVWDMNGEIEKTDGLKKEFVFTYTITMEERKD